MTFLLPLLPFTIKDFEFTIKKSILFDIFELDFFLVNCDYLHLLGLQFQFSKIKKRFLINRLQQ